MTKAYKVTIEDYGTQTVSLGAVVRSDAFDKKYAYDGDDLGVTYKAESPHSSCGRRPPPR